MKKLLLRALGVSAGVMLGGCLLPRLLWPALYNDSWPPLWQHALLTLAVGFAAAFLVLWLLDRLKRRGK